MASSSAGGGGPSPGRGRGSRSRGRGGRGGRGNGPNKGKGDDGNNNKSNDGDGASTPSSGKSSGGGRNNRRRHFSARGGGGGAGRGNGGGGRGSSAGDAPVPAPALAASDDKDPQAQAPTASGNGAEEKVRNMSDQDILIAFGPFVRAGDPKATSIHRDYLSHQRQPDFIRNARVFLVEKEGAPSAQEAPAEVSKPESESPTVPAPPPGMQMQLPANQSAAQSNGANFPPPPPGMGSLPHPQMPVQSNVPVGGIGAANNSTTLPLPPPGMGSMPPIPQAKMTGPPPGMPPPLRTPTKAEGVASPASNTPSSILPARTPAPATKAAEAPPATPAKPMRVRRTQTRCEEQPGRLFANDMPAAAFNAAAASPSDNKPTSLTSRPRSELTARWVLPLPYLRNRAIRRFEELKASNGGVAPPQNLTIRDALRNLAVGLFRRGAMDTGSQSAIVSKEILASDDGNQPSGRPSKDYFFNVDQRADSVFGTVPFYAPRTPGNVVFRLYFEDEPHVTLATGPCIHVVPGDGDVDSVLRFILSNFKSKKTNGISSMNSLASVFELFSPRQDEKFFEGAGRVAWGCMCESRKVVHQAGLNYLKRKVELEAKIAEEKEAEKIKEDLPDLSSLGIEGQAGASDADASAKDTLSGEEKDKSSPSEAQTKLATEAYSNERKWREIQQVYASILKAIVSNEANQLLMKRDMSKIRLEYELWCPFVEAFAPNPFVAGNDKASKLPGDISAFPNSNAKEHVKKAQESRTRAQEIALGFLPKSTSPLTLKTRSHKWKKSGLDFFTELSSAMNKLYYDEYAVSDKVWKRREKVRAAIEQVMATSGEFPVGTKVRVFGSSANGFGSPSSDLDLCLQIPTAATDFTKEKGVEAMTNLAIKFTEAGMTDVDTVRLTARIPIVKFNVPYSDEDGNILVECDLSLQNPLACLNTTLLHAYSKISPTTCVLASIIKRFAKSRDINNPSKHTLSSYGYVIMLIHFLTACDFTLDGFVAKPESANQINPILPNLQWVDPVWAQKLDGIYREIPAKPRTQLSMVQHPTESKYYVNSYFYCSELDGLKQYCSKNHNTKTAVGALLASFFHYYAYDFDYKKHIVSLNKKHSSPMVEREVKAEEDGWSLYRQGLAIEDPFELFYDVAHVLKASNFHLIRKEFSLAYTKIMNAAMTSKELPTGRELIDLICEPVASEEQDSA